MHRAKTGINCAREKHASNFALTGSQQHGQQCQSLSQGTITMLRLGCARSSNGRVLRVNGYPTFGPWLVCSLGEGMSSHLPPLLGPGNWHGVVWMLRRRLRAGPSR